MRASFIGTSRVIQALASCTVTEAAQTMRQQQVGCIVVVQEQDLGALPIGIVTDRDLVTEAIAAGCDADATTLDMIMSSPLATCREDATLAEVVAIMRGSGVRRLPIVDADGLMVGIVSADDVLVAMTELLERLSGAMINDPMLDRRYA